MIEATIVINSVASIPELASIDFPGLESLTLETKPGATFTSPVVVKDDAGNIVSPEDLRFKVETFGIVDASITSGVLDMHITGAGAGSVSVSVERSTNNEVLPFFEDDFASGDFSKTENVRGFNWNEGKGSFNASVQSDWTYDGDAFAAMLTYPGSAPGGLAIAQLAWALDVPLQENQSLYIEYMQYIPDGTEPTGDVAWLPRIREGGTVGGGKYGRVWGGGKASGYDDSMSIGHAFEPRADVPNHGAWLKTGHRDTEHFPSGGTWEFSYELEFEGTNGVPAGSIKRGQWQRIGFEYKTSSDNGVYDGLIRNYVDGVLIGDFTVRHVWREGPNGDENKLRAGYFWGNTNYGYDDTTHIYFARVRFFDTDPGWG